MFTPAFMLRSAVGASVALLCAAGAASAQVYPVEKPRRQFVTISYHWISNQPLHFDDHPLEDLVGADVAEAQFEAYDYRTRDGAILIDVLEFSRRARGAGINVYPFGLSAGPALALRVGYEQLPIIRIDFEGAGAPADYALTSARSYEAGVGLYVADRSAGWGLGSHAFVAGGVGRIRSSQGEGERYFAEGGGGLNSGPIGIELSVKFSWNHLTEPVDHRFLAVPVTVRGTLSF
jgi:hypothetical protein